MFGFDSKETENLRARFRKIRKEDKAWTTAWAADCDKVVIENPTPSKVYDYPEPTQAVQPYEYGHPFTKKTLLWERGVEPLRPTNAVVPERTWCPSGSYSGKHKEKHRGMFTKDRARNRSKTFPGIAKAMAEQWGGLCE